MRKNRNNGRGSRGKERESAAVRHGLCAAVSRAGAPRERERGWGGGARGLRVGV